MTFTSATPLNILDPCLYAGDPRPAYRWLREQAPAYWDPANRIWGISRHEDVLSVERDTARYSSARGSRPLIEMSASMINRDDPRHLQQRKLLSGRFSPRAVRSHSGPDSGTTTLASLPAHRRPSANSPPPSAS